MFSKVTNVFAFSLCRKLGKFQSFRKFQSIGQIFFRNIGKSCRQWHLYCLPAPIGTVYAFSFGKSKEKKVSDEEKPDELKTVIETADKLYLDYKIQELYDYLIEFKDCESDEVMWRLARAATDKGKASSDQKVKKSCMYEAFEYAKKALQLNDKNFACHKWYAVLLDYTGEYEGTKARISNSFSVKKHFLRAVELNPKDATSIHSIGYWCFVFADLPWYTRKLAAALFATPPTSTYSEALYYFQLAEEVDPDFYSMNLLMIGKTHLRMKNYIAAKTYLLKARDYPVLTPDDEKAHEEAIQLLKSIGLKDK
ncbi:regulator of microtubule dynamics protein 1-like [Saccostrea echinata]|uniref:regulator of microtubule dynamics protein 1-like n=1 Tax=Saccostrea echinata TaxID=191078 RepID=UPI002A81062E|nr:regulator of microtubule dynamics protein 1-like [Saccostrea echinata]